MRFTTSRQARLAGVRGEVTAWHTRLAADLAGLDPAGDPGCRRALTDAAERYVTSARLLASADSLGDLLVARRMTIEGLAAARSVRAQQGLALGEELPDPGSPTVAELAATPHARTRRGAAGSGAGPAIGPEAGNVALWRRVAAIGATLAAPAT